MLPLGVFSKQLFHHKNKGRIKVYIKRKAMGMEAKQGDANAKG